MSNSHFRKRPGAGDMTIFGFHVGLHITNPGYLEVYAGIWGCMGVYGGIWDLWEHMVVYGSIWGYVEVYGGI